MTGKADFSHVYDAPDPRAYYNELGRLDYEIPAHGTPVFRALVDELGGDDTTVLDVCCSYGVNAALLNHDVSFAELTARYTSPELAPLDRGELVASDRAFFAELRHDDAVDVIGLDVSGNAVEYGVDAGLLTAGIAADLEASTRPADEVVAQLAEVDLVTVTGGVGYVNERTSERVVEASGDEPPWIAALTLRWIAFEPIAETLEDHGLVTEHIDGYCVPQRRCATETEQAYVLDQLEHRGLEPTPREQAGWQCADLYVVRPPESVRDRPIGAVRDGVLPE